MNSRTNYHLSLESQSDLQPAKKFGLIFRVYHRYGSCFWGGESKASLGGRPGMCATSNVGHQNVPGGSDDGLSGGLAV